MPLVEMFQKPTDVTWFAAVEENIGIWPVRIAAICIAREQPEGHQRIEEVAGTAPVQSKPADEGIKLQWPLGQRGENTEFDSAEQRLGPPEGVR